VGLFAGLLPPVRGKREVLMLATYGAVSGYLFGFMLNLSFWPFTVDPHSSVAYAPAASFATNVQHYLVFDATTSLGWDTGRAVTNFVLILLVGPAMLATFRRASRRASFGAPIVFEPAGVGGSTDETGALSGVEVTTTPGDGEDPGPAPGDARNHHRGRSGADRSAETDHPQTGHPERTAHAGTDIEP
jgi:hypothetical protein